MRGHNPPPSLYQYRQLAGHQTSLLAFAFGGLAVAQQGYALPLLLDLPQLRDPASMVFQMAVVDVMMPGLVPLFQATLCRTGILPGQAQGDCLEDMCPVLYIPHAGYSSHSSSQKRGLKPVWVAKLRRMLVPFLPLHPGCEKYLCKHKILEHPGDVRGSGERNGWIVKPWHSLGKRIIRWLRGRCSRRGRNGRWPGTPCLPSP